MRSQLILQDTGEQLLMSQPKKTPDLSADILTSELLELIVDSYFHPSSEAKTAKKHGSSSGQPHKQLKTLAEEFGITPLKARKLLITAGVYKTPVGEQIQQLHSKGMSIAQIQQKTGLSRASVHSYLPYSKAVYNLKKKDPSFPPLPKRPTPKDSAGTFLKTAADKAASASQLRKLLEDTICSDSPTEAFPEVTAVSDSSSWILPADETGSSGWNQKLLEDDTGSSGWNQKLPKDAAAESSEIFEMLWEVLSAYQGDSFPPLPKPPFLLGSLRWFAAQFLQESTAC